jgi:hypothetical protein
VLRAYTCTHTKIRCSTSCELSPSTRIGFRSTDTDHCLDAFCTWILTNHQVSSQGASSRFSSIRCAHSIFELIVGVGANDPTLSLFVLLIGNLFTVSQDCRYETSPEHGTALRGTLKKYSHSDQCVSEQTTRFCSNVCTIRRIKHLLAVFSLGTKMLRRGNK